MSYICCRNGFNFSESVQVEAPADVLWEIVKDLSSLPEVVTSVVGFEWVSGNTTKVGARFRETRTCKNSRYTLHKTITRLEDSNLQERSLSLGISFRHANDKICKDVVNTSTIIVQKVGDHSSRLILTGAVESGHFLDRLNYLFCYPCIRNFVRISAEQEIDDYRVAAEQRYQETIANASTD